MAWPFYVDLIRRIELHRDVPVFLHTDGDIRSLLPRIVACGFDELRFPCSPAPVWISRR